MSGFRKQAVDQTAHAIVAFLVLCFSSLLGVEWTAPGAILVAWSLGILREVTEWQEGGASPFTPAGLLDQAGWAAGGLAFSILAV